MGYVFNAEDAQNYESWLANEKNRIILDLETGLMKSLLRPMFGDSLLDVGCGTGESIKPYLGKGVSLTGIDPSSHMLDIAREKIGHRADFHRGFAEDLPFDDNSFNHVSLFLTLEFTANPDEAISEACRVAKDSVFIGILNRNSAYVTKLRISRLVKRTIYQNACFLSIGQVRKMLFKHIGQVPFTWKTVIQLPFAPGIIIRRFESGGYLQKSPFGAFAGIRATPVPRLRTIPLTLKSRLEQNAAAHTRVVSCSEFHSKKTECQNMENDRKQEMKRLR
jgi:SAM-dependent methyltransferase